MAGFLSNLVGGLGKGISGLVGGLGGAAGDVMGGLAGGLGGAVKGLGGAIGDIAQSPLGALGMGAMSGIPGMGLLGLASQAPNLFNNFNGLLGGGGQQTPQLPPHLQGGPMQSMSGPLQASMQQFPGMTQYGGGMQNPQSIGGSQMMLNRPGISPFGPLQQQMQMFR